MTNRAFEAMCRRQDADRRKWNTGLRVALIAAAAIITAGILIPAV